MRDPAGSAPTPAPRKMTLLGSGVRTPYVFHGLIASQAALGLTEVVLHDADHDRLDLMAAFGAYLCEQWGATFTVRAEHDARAALSGARFVFAAIRVGQDTARTLDEQLPLKYGVLGQETTGPGGFAMALRTIPAMIGYGHLISEVAPDALLVNFTNPVGLILQALHDHTSVRAVGVCDGPIQMKRSVAQFLGVPGDQVHADYFGLNHAGWIHRVLVDGRDRLPEILGRYEELQRLDHSWRLFQPELIRSIGMLPMEYLYFYYYRQQAVAHILASGGTRGEQIAALTGGLWPAIAQRVAAGDFAGAHSAWDTAMQARGDTYFARERGAEAAGSQDLERDRHDMVEGEGYEGLAAAVMMAAVQRRKVPLILNTPNLGAIPGLDDDDVVEVTAMVDEHGAHPLAQGRMPAHARALIEPLKAYERLTVRAAVEGSAQLAIQALMVHPLVGSFEIAKALVQDYLTAHAEFLPAFA